MLLLKLSFNRKPLRAPSGEPGGTKITDNSDRLYIDAEAYLAVNHYRIFLLIARKPWILPKMNMKFLKPF